MKLFIFDMGGVVSTNNAVVPAIAADMGISVDDFFRGAGSVEKADGLSLYHSGDTAALTRGDIDTKQFWLNFEKRTGIPVKGDPWYDYYHPLFNKETGRIISELKKQGNRVVCGTNTLAVHYKRHEEQGDYACFDKVYASHLMRLIKPDPAFWKFILRQENTQAEDAFFIDDAEENTAAAGKLGMKTHTFVDADRLRTALGKAAW